MEKIASLIKNLENKRWLMLILIMTILLRLPGILYGFPMWLIEDEPAFVTSALKMIELKNPIPALNYDEFKGLLYYQPLLPLFYLIPFGILLIGKLAVFSGNFQEFIFYTKADLSSFFILARLIALAFSAATVLLTYAISKNIFGNKKIGLLSATFLSLSLLHINFSPIGKEWMPTLTMLLGAIYLLSNKNISEQKRYLLSGLFAGLAFGFSNVGGFTMPLILLWYLFMDNNSIWKVFKEKYLYQVLTIFLAIAAITTAVAPFDFFIAGGERTISEPKNIAGWLKNFYVFLWPVAKTEPILSIFTFIGLIFSIKKYRGYFNMIMAFIMIYISAFYILFYHQHRYLLPLFPLLAITAGFGLYESKKYIEGKSKLATNLMLVLVMAGLLIPAMKFSQVTYNNDVRIIARKWIIDNLPENTKILTYSELTRLNSTREAILEQENIDPNSLRQIDYAEKYFGKNPNAEKSFHALNLYSVSNNDFFENIEEYIEKNNYKYLLISLEQTPNLNHIEKLWGIANKSKEVRIFRDSNKLQPEETIIHHLTIDNFGNIINLFKLNYGGQPLGLYEIKI